MKYCTRICTIALLGLVMSPAWASLESTAGFTAEPERAQLIVTQDARDRVTLELIELGVEPDLAMDRVGRMTDREVAQIQDRVGEMPAGGMSTTNLLLIIVILILLL